MNAIDEIRARLAKYPEVRYSETATSIEVHAACETGFPVGLQIHGDGFVVSFAGWHEEFESQEEALNCFAFGLSSDCRLRVVCRGSTPTRWIVEHKQDHSWIKHGETGLLFVPFWRSRRVVYLQNDLLSSAE